jgi:hypothetical protein
LNEVEAGALACRWCNRKTVRWQKDGVFPACGTLPFKYGYDIHGLSVLKRSLGIFQEITIFFVKPITNCKGWYNMSAILGLLAGNWQMQKKAEDGQILSNPQLHIETDITTVTKVTLDGVNCEFDVPGFSFTCGDETYNLSTTNIPNAAQKTMTGDWVNNVSGNTGTWDATKN